jgi:hypothetical protein
MLDRPRELLLLRAVPEPSHHVVPLRASLSAMRHMTHVLSAPTFVSMDTILCKILCGVVTLRIWVYTSKCCVLQPRDMSLLDIQAALYSTVFHIQNKLDQKTAAGLLCYLLCAMRTSVTPSDIVDRLARKQLCTQADIHDRLMFVNWTVHMLAFAKQLLKRQRAVGVCRLAE